MRAIVRACAVLAVAVSCCAATGVDNRAVRWTSPPRPHRCVARTDTVTLVANHLLPADLRFQGAPHAGDTLDFETADGNHLGVHQGSPGGDYLLGNGAELHLVAGPPTSYQVVVRRRAIEAHIVSAGTVVMVVAPEIPPDVGEELVTGARADPVVGPTTYHSAFIVPRDSYTHARLYVDRLRTEPFTLTFVSVPRKFGEHLGRGEPMDPAILDEVARTICTVRVEPWNGRVAW